MKVLVIDDHPLIREALVGVLQRLAPGVEPRTASNCERGLELAAEPPPPALVLLDLHLPGLAGLDAVHAWRARFPALPLVVLSAQTEAEVLRAALAAGAAGYVPKTSSNEVMLAALRLVLDGGRYLPPELLTPQPLLPGGVAAAHAGAGPFGLTERQYDVLRLVARGVPNKVICRELNLAERTVKAHVTAVMRALKVSSRTQVALVAARHGLASTDAVSAAP